MSFLGFGKKTPEEVSKKIAEFANSIKIKAQKVIESEARDPSNYKNCEESLENLDQIEQMVKDATKKAKDRLKHSFV